MGYPHFLENPKQLLCAMQWGGEPLLRDPATEMPLERLRECQSPEHWPRREVKATREPSVKKTNLDSAIGYVLGVVAHLISIL